MGRPTYNLKDRPNDFLASPPVQAPCHLPVSSPAAPPWRRLLRGRSSPTPPAAARTHSSSCARAARRARTAMLAPRCRPIELRITQPGPGMPRIAVLVPDRGNGEVRRDGACGPWRRLHPCPASASSSVRVAWFPPRFPGRRLGLLRLELRTVARVRYD